MTKFIESGIGLMHQDSEYDKYTFKHEVQVDYQSRLHICMAVCCRFPFALSRLDVEEGIINWEFGRPYLIAHDADGYCIYLDMENCTVWEYRPVPCRGFDCKDNEKWKVWEDYEEMEVNERLMEQIEDSNKKVYDFIQSANLLKGRSVIKDG